MTYNSEEGIVGTQHITINRTSAVTNQGGIVWVKCVLDCLRSSLLKRRKAKYKREREARDHVRTCNLLRVHPIPTTIERLVLIIAQLAIILILGVLRLISII
jgi:hypothetical protein